MTQSTPVVLDQVTAALTDDYESARAIWRRVDCWSPITIRNILGELTKQGRAESQWAPMHIGGVPDQQMRLFRRKQREPGNTNAA